MEMPTPAFHWAEDLCTSLLFEPTGSFLRAAAGDDAEQRLDIFEGFRHALHDEQVKHVKSRRSKKKEQ